MAVTVAELGQFIRETPEGVAVRRLRVGDRLYLEVRRSTAGPAKSSWVLRYTHDGKKQSLGLGMYFLQAQRGAVGHVKLADAIKASAVKLADIDKGIQPVRARRATAQKLTADSSALAALESRTVRKACDQWHEATKSKLTSDKYRGQRWRRLAEYLDHIGDTPVASLTVADVADTFAKLGASERAETFRRSSADLEKSIDYAGSLGWFDGVNPVTRARRGLDKPKQVGRRFFKIEKLPEFCRAMLASGGPESYPVTAHLLRLLALTAARTGEIRLLKWSEVDGLDGDKPMLHVPAERMKKRLAWAVPLSRQAADLLRDIKHWQSAVGDELQGVNDGFVFVRLTGNYKGRLCSENAVNDLLQDMGWGADLVGHGLRKVFSTVAHDSWPYHGANRTEAIEFSMAHVHQDKVRGTYDTNDYMNQRRELLQWWADHLDLMAKSQPGNVVPIRPAVAA